MEPLAVVKSTFNNVTPREKLKKDLTNSFNELLDILKYHAGPFASNCVIGSKWRQVNDVDEFTKDGVKILLHMIVSEDVVERFATRMIRFIGLSVDKRCFDGTTTAMLLLCYLSNIAISKLDSDPLSLEAYEWGIDIRDLLSECMEYIDDLKITDEDILNMCKSHGIDTTIEDVRASMAYHMAMISSKGDTDLATKIAYVVKSAPKKIHGMFKDFMLAVETEESYILKKQECDLAISCNIGHIQDYNYKNDTQFLAEDAVIFATGNEIVTSSMESAFLSSLISTNLRLRADLEPSFGVTSGWEDLCEGKKHLIIITPLMNDVSLIEHIAIFNMTHPKCRISWFNSHITGLMRTSLNKTLHYMSGAELFPDVMSTNALDSLIGLTGSKVKAHFIGNVLMLSGLYEKTGEVYHPFYTDRTLFTPYSDFVTETEELIEFATKNITNPALNADELTYLTSLYRSLTCQEIYDIEIGGSVHDQRANLTVYEDAIGAALSAVREGVILGGYAHLASFVHSKLSTINNIELGTAFFESLVSVVADSMRVSDREALKDIILTLEDKWVYLACDTVRDKGLESLGEYDNNPYLYSKTKLYKKSNLIKFLSRESNSPILLQAYGGYNEQFKRFRDILPRLANTTHLVDMRIKDDSNVR